MKNRIRTLLLTLLTLVITHWAQAQSVAKVGSTEYATIEEAIEAWGPGKTLTLLADVQTSSTVTVEVNATKSTQGWTLNLGNYTWTANGCNAFKLYAAGGTVMNQNYGLKIYANQSGGITASGKYCIECTYDNSKTRYRPRLEIHGGTYNGSYVIYYYNSQWSNSNIENGPSTHIFKSDDGTEPVFNGNFGLYKCPLTINAGYFNGTSFNTYPVGSTADTYLYGGHFKTYSAFPSASNNKGINFGNYKVFVKSDASIDVVNGAPATYEAKATKTLLLSAYQSVNYSDYVYYEKADDAINKYSSGTIEIILSNNVEATASKSFRSGTLTIDASAEGAAYTGSITLTGSSAIFIIKFPEGKGYSGVTVSTGQLHVTESVANGIVTRTYSVQNVSNPEAKVGDTGYSTVYDAFYAVDGTTDNKTIVLQKDVTNAGIITNGTATGGDGKTVATFDLNGYSIGVTSVGAGNNADYTLTIIDSSEGKTGTVTNSDASLFLLALTGINDYSGTYTLKIQAGTWMFDPSNVTVNGETYNMVDVGYVAHDNGNGTWTVGEMIAVAKIGETKYSTLQSAVNAAKQMGGTQTITIINDISGETVTIPEEANFKLTIDGQKDASSNYTVDALIIVDGLRGNGGSTTNGASVTIQNIAFVKSTATDGIQATHYPHHLTIQDCTYSGSDNDKWFFNASVDGPLYGVTIKNVTVEHARLIYANMAEDAVFQNITATNDIKVGFNVKTSGTALIENCEVTTGKYAFRDYLDGYAGTFTLKDNTFISTSNESDEGAIVNRGGADGAHINVISGTYTGPVKVLNNKEGVLAISGGYFSEEFPQDYIAANLVAQGKICIPATDKEGYFTIGAPHYVAQIGETGYVTLQAAVDAAQQLGGAQTINIIDNISGETVTINEVANFKLTIDGQKDASSNYTVDALIIVDGLRGNGGSTTNGASVTIQNIAFVKSTATDGIQASHYPHHLTIQDCTYSGSNNDKWFFNASVDGPLYGVTIKNVTVEHARLIYANMAEDAVFQNITATNDIKVGFNVKTSGTALIENCEVTTGKYAFRDYLDGYAGTFTLKDNTFVSTTNESDEGVIVNRGGVVGTAHINVVSGTYTGPVKVLNNKEGVLAISGGYFSEEFPQDYIAANLVAQGKVCVPATDKEGYFTIGDPHYVAQIDETGYVTLQAAVDAVPANGTETTIVMIDDETINTNAGVTIPATKNVVLDLNGKTVTGVVQSAASAQTILNKGTLVVTDSSEEKNGTITNVVSDENAGSPGDGKNWFSNAITNNGTLTVNAGNIVNTGTGGACYAIDNITNGTLCTPVLNIAGGNISAKKVAVRMFCNSTTNDNTVNVTGGVISSENAYAIQSQQANNNANKAVLNISGGTLSGQYAFCDYGNKNVASQFDNASYSITGGFFSGYMWSYATYYCGMDGFVSGGYFDNVVGGDIVAPGSACVDNTEEETMEAYPYTIGLADIYYYWLNNSGQIDGGGYYTIYAPFAGPDPVLMDGEFVELQKNVTLIQDIEYIEEVSFGDPIFKGGTFTLKFGEYDIDLNGHVFPIPTGVTILTDKQTDIFTAAEPGYIVLEETTETGYAYSVVALPSSSLIVFHDSGEYEQAFEVPMYTRMAGADIYYKVNGGSAQKYTGALSISDNTNLEAWLQVGSTKVGESITRTYTIVTPTTGPSVTEGYYTIKNNGNGNNVNVAGRKTVTFVSDKASETAAGTVIKVKATNGKVEVLRSQGIDLPGYANRAMKYVPEMVQLIISKLHADGGGNILGENGVDAIMTKFNDSFDYNLYLEEYNGGLRIYGRTPSMKPVVDFYAENKDRVDAKLPELETFINNAITKLKGKLNGRGQSILQPFSVHTIWQKMGGTLTEPLDEASIARFYEEVLASENNVWEFAYQTAMMYYEPLMASETFQGAVAQLGDYSKYLDKLPNVRPNFKYYIVADDSKVDFISEGNPNVDTNYGTWTLEDRPSFTVMFEDADKLVDGLGTKYYTTLYTDFAYTMPENAKAYAVIGYNAKGIADLEEITGVIPAQTPVLLMTQDEGLEATLTLSTEAGTAPDENMLKGNDWVVNKYNLQTTQLHDMFELVKDELGEDFYNNYLAEYEHLLALNAGTVNNKYFFGLKAEVAEGVTNLRQLGVDEDEDGEMRLGFWEKYEAMPANKAFLIEDPSPVLLPIWPDVNCDGIIDISDAIAIIDIIMDDDFVGPDWKYPYYNHQVADVNQDGEIEVTDAVLIIDIIDKMNDY